MVYEYLFEASGGSRVGPYKIELIKGWIKAGYVKMEDPAIEGLDKWVKVKDVPGIEVVSAGMLWAKT